MYYKRNIFNVYDILQKLKFQRVDDDLIQRFNVYVYSELKKKPTDDNEKQCIVL